MPEFEVESFIQRNIAEVDDNGYPQVVRNGYGKSRSITTGCGDFEIKAPRVDDRREGKKFLSQTLPPYLMGLPKVERLLPVLYLEGLSMVDPIV